MKDSWENFRNAFKEVYSSYWGILITLVFTFIVFAVNPLLSNYRLLIEQFSFTLMWELIVAAPATTAVSSLIVLVIISVLSGMVFTYMIFLLRRQVNASAGIGILGIVVGLFAPACPACALGLLSIVGLGGFLGILPFGGRELGIIGIGLLVFSLGYMSKKINTKVCPISFSKKGKKKRRK
tara:strand:+ start:156 stop:698 length:543 start_codon:yes stop_codon:yes gene_type:complete